MSDSSTLSKSFMRIVLVLVSILPGATNVVTGQRLGEDPRMFGGPERKFYVGVPTKVPLKFDVRNVTSDDWVRDLEIEVTNTSDKPIYYLDMRLFLVGTKLPLRDSEVSYWIKYGRIDLISVSAPLVPEDNPISPGEKHIFKLTESDAKSWDYPKNIERVAEPKALKMLFQNLNFGDGTGFSDTSARPVDIHRKVSRAAPVSLEFRFIVTHNQLTVRTGNLAGR